MAEKYKEKQRAIDLRKRGMTYSEILKRVPVAKSTLSLWLREVGLSKDQQQVISRRRKIAQQKGAAARRTARQATTRKIYMTAASQIGEISSRELFLVGVALYWAEGSKEKPHNISQGVDFCNSDGHMVKLFLAWLRDSLGVEANDIKFSLYIHENSRDRMDLVRKYWRETLKMPQLHFSYTYFKKHNPRTRRRNTEDNYFGTVRVTVAKSSGLQRRISGWIYGITGAPCRVV